MHEEQRREARRSKGNKENTGTINVGAGLTVSEISIR